MIHRLSWRARRTGTCPGTAGIGFAGGRIGINFKSENWSVEE
jgi:hypothetical protein